MRVDFQQGDHLRVGRLLIARARQVESGPIVDGGGTGLVRIDETAALEVVADARVLCEAIHEGTAPGSPVIGGGGEVLAAAAELRGALCGFAEGQEVDHFGSLVFHLPGSSRAIAVGWLDASPPRPYRWRPRFLLAQARWVLAGRPANVYVADVGELRPRGPIEGAHQGPVEFIERSALAGDFVRRDGSHGTRYHEVTPFGDGR